MSHLRESLDLGLAARVSKHTFAQLKTQKTQEVCGTALGARPIINFSRKRSLHTKKIAAATGSTDTLFPTRNYAQLQAHWTAHRRTFPGKICTPIRNLETRPRRHYPMPPPGPQTPYPQPGKTAWSDSFPGKSRFLGNSAADTPSPPVSSERFINYFIGVDAIFFQSIAANCSTAHRAG